MFERDFRSRAGVLRALARAAERSARVFTNTQPSEGCIPAPRDVGH